MKAVRHKLKNFYLPTLATNWGVWVPVQGGLSRMLATAKPFEKWPTSHWCRHICDW
jgi:hypothetical protein